MSDSRKPGDKVITPVIMNPPKEVTWGPVAEPSREQAIQEYTNLWGSTRGEAERVIALQARIQVLEHEIMVRDEGLIAVNQRAEAAEQRVKELEAERDMLKAIVQQGTNAMKERDDLEKQCEKAWTSYQEVGQFWGEAADRAEKAEQQATALREALGILVKAIDERRNFDHDVYREAWAHALNIGLQALATSENKAHNPS